ncbi:Ran-binding protein [Mycena indigotica]|uniref:Ran-binding protein n=1 Tax=Mycena indigotica TaxID=2126181 RepID=A0A8H6W9B5_9AGAR|nr:Ran-binding protein [Mycena indigotica]KAF7306438.1 Ran-binding protein [Mycena indigotica]
MGRVRQGVLIAGDGRDTVSLVLETSAMSRPARSASIPIPRNTVTSSSARNIESVISLPFGSSPFTPSPRSRGPQPIPIAQNRSAEEQRTSVRNVRGSSSVATSISPTRPAARSLTHSSPNLITRSSPRSSPFEPRVIRAESVRVATIDPACLSTSPSSSLPRTRRPSSTVTTPRVSSSHRNPSGITQTTPALQLPTFARPTYLEESALRHLLQTEAPPSISPHRKSAQSNQRSLSSSSDSDEEGSPPPRRRNPTSYASPDVLRLPTRWSETYRNDLLSISADGRDITFQGASCNGDKEAAAARTTRPIPPACGIYYYEVDIISKGNKGHISIGFGGKDVKLSRLPGWEPNSWGYHGDDGCSFAAEKTGSPFGPTYGTGDTIGCGIDFSANQAFFTKNGSFIGTVFKDVGKTMDLYPSIGLRHSGEAIRVNFGQDKFHFEIDFYVQQRRTQTWSDIMATKVSTSLLSSAGPSSVKIAATQEQTRGAINKLVLSYLAHHGYSKTARAFQKQSQRPSRDLDVDMDNGSDDALGMDGDMERRTQIVNSVIQGDIDTALADTRKHYPNVLTVDEGLMLFKLRCRKFIELLLETTELKKQMDVEMSSMKPPGGAIDDDEMGMDIDEDALPLVDVVINPPSETPRSSKDKLEAALNQAIHYGQSMLNDYSSDKRPEVQSLFKRTVGIVAFHDPIAHGGVAAEIARPEARNELANELNQAILRSQGRPPQPALETIFRHTAACVHQLGMIGVGAAAFADIQKEFLSDTPQ